MNDEFIKGKLLNCLAGGPIIIESGEGGEISLYQGEYKKEPKTEFITTLTDDIFDQNILETLCVNSKLPFKGQRIKISLEVLK